MNTILVCGSNNESKTYSLVYSALSAYGKVHGFDSENCFLGFESPEFCIMSQNRIPKIKDAGGILIFDNKFEIPENQVALSHMTPVFDSNNKNAAKALANSGSVAVSCGTSQKDTLSLASLDSNSAFISLQRKIVALNGSEIEPHDFTVKFKTKTTIYPLLAACAALLICGISSNEGFEF
ncbi:MAG: hypothetical protein Q8876_01760 [Bacillota bacterium]|nr:hypothetical protein [Bacillota bacterium]